MSSDPTQFAKNQNHQITHSSSTVSWWIGGSASLIGLTVFLSTSLWHSRMIERDDKSLLRWQLFCDAALGMLAGLFVLRVVKDDLETRQAIKERLESIAELNHQVRNALQVIELSAHSTRNEEAIAHISDAVGRIERVLRGLDEVDKNNVSSIKPLKKVS